MDKQRQVEVYPNTLAILWMRFVRPVIYFERTQIVTTFEPYISKLFVYILERA